MLAPSTSNQSAPNGNEISRKVPNLVKRLSNWCLQLSGISIILNINLDYKWRLMEQSFMSIIPQSLLPIHTRFYSLNIHISKVCKGRKSEIVGVEGHWTKSISEHFQHPFKHIFILNFIYLPAATDHWAFILLLFFEMNVLD